MSNEYGGYQLENDEFIWHDCLCPKFITNLSSYSTHFNNKDPCKSCGHRLKDHPEFKKKDLEK